MLNDNATLKELLNNYIEQTSKVLKHSSLLNDLKNKDIYLIEEAKNLIMNINSAEKDLEVISIQRDKLNAQKELLQKLENAPPAGEQIEREQSRDLDTLILPPLPEIPDTELESQETSLHSTATFVDREEEAPAAKQKPSRVKVFNSLQAGAKKFWEESVKEAISSVVNSGKEKQKIEDTLNEMRKYVGQYMGAKDRLKLQVGFSKESYTKAEMLADMKKMQEAFVEKLQGMQIPEEIEKQALKYQFSKDPSKKNIWNDYNGCAN